MMSQLRAVGSRRGLRFLRPLASAATVLAVAALAVGAYWVCSAAGEPAALPSGEPLAIVTEPNPPESDFCQLARMSGLVMKRSGSEVIFEGGLGITWPYGTKALLVDGKAQLFAPEGWLIGTEGQTLPDLWGGLGVDDRFHVCHIVRPDG
jgi:hypothetical protein